MDKMTKVLFIIWAILAVASFVAGFYAPMLIRIIEVVFGIFNIAILIAWASSSIKELKEHRNKMKMEE